MNRQQLVKLFQNGLTYPPGKYLFRYSRTFEVMVHSDRKVELDEYEGFTVRDGSVSKAQDRQDRRTRRKEVPLDEKVFHLGRSILHLDEGRVEEEPGTGWKKR